MGIWKSENTVASDNLSEAQVTALTTGTNADGQHKHAKLIPTADATDAIQITKADGTTAVLNVDTTNSRVGIGTTNPNEILTILSPTYNGSAIGLYNTFDWVSNRNWSICLNQTAYGDLHFKQSNAQNGNPISNGTSRLTISPSGNVGIGTTSPSSTLEVAGTVTLKTATAATPIFLGDLNCSVHKLSNEASPNVGSITSFNSFTPTTADILLVGHSGVSLGTKSGGDRLGLRLTSAGNVGIGTTAPAEKLEVSGNIKITGNMLKMTGITTATRDGLTAVAGDIIYNTTTNKHQGYNGTAWNDLY